MSFVVHKHADTAKKYKHVHFIFKIRHRSIVIIIGYVQGENRSVQLGKGMVEDRTIGSRIVYIILHYYGPSVPPLERQECHRM